jgi:site-specific recombinase XerD
MIYGNYSKRKSIQRKRNRWSRPLLIREQLTIYHLDAVQDIPYKEQYLQYLLTERGFKPGTAQNNLNTLKQFSRFLQQNYNMHTFQPRAVTPGYVRRYLAYLKNERGNSPSTRNGKLGVLKGYYIFLEYCGYLAENDNPVQFIRRARVPSRLPVYLNLEEAEKLLQAASAGPQPERDVAILRVMLQGGLRVGELLRLRVEDVDFKDRCLFIQGKGEKERLVPFTKNTATALEAYLAVRLPASDWIKELFLNRDGKPLHQVGLNQWFHRLCEKAGVQKPGLSVRNLRHTCLTLLMQEGAELMALKKLAGHNRLSTTQSYLRVTQNQLRQAIKKHPLG